MPAISAQPCPTPAPVGMEKQREAAIAKSREVCEKIRTLGPTDKADILDLVLDVLLDFPNVEPERIGETFILIKEIAEQKREDVSTVEVGDWNRPSDLGVREAHRTWQGWVAYQIKEKRNEKNWTQNDLAKESGLPQSHISRLETGKHSPSRKTLEKIARALGIGIETFKYPND